jgi:hypothetical protein
VDTRCAILDAYVLYPAPVRDLMLQLARDGAYRARWTNDIHDEWIRNVLRNRPDLTTAQLACTRRQMDTHIPDALVGGHARWIDSVQLPDPDDRHVVAAAIAAGATLIVTFNLRDSPAPALAPFDIEAIHPDALIVQLLEEEPALLRPALAIQQRLVKTPIAFDAYVARLADLGLPRSAEVLQRLAAKQ